MKKNAKIMTLSVIGVVLTWWINTQLGLGPAVASGIIGLLAALILPTDLAVATYTASFVGMSSATVVTGLSMALTAGILVGVIFCIALPVYQGFGGKLGTIAAVAVLATVFIFSLIT
jgi:hypothetical protein